MIHFFRKIRKKMADDNKLFKYSRYAIGEIVLVVIGILIALQINTWKEEQKSKKLEQTYLIRLQNDLVKDTLYLVHYIQNFKKQKANIYQFVHELYNVQKTEEEFRQLFLLQSYFTENLVMQTITYEELKNTGLINLFQNETLKIEILDLYRTYEVAANHFIEINNFTAREVFSKSVSVGAKYYKPELYDEQRLFEGTDWKFINEPNSESFKLIEETQVSYYVKYDILIGNLEKLIAKSKLLIDNISDELEERK